MVEAFDGPFAASHDHADLCIRHILDKLKNEQCLSFGRQSADKLKQRVLFLRADQRRLRAILPGRQHRQFIERNFLPPAAVSVPVRDQVVSDTIQPGRERDTAVRVIVYVIHRPLKDAGSQVLRIVCVPGPIVNIVEDAVDITFVEQTKRITVAL